MDALMCVIHSFKPLVNDYYSTFSSFIPAPTRELACGLTDLFYSYIAS